ncbi:KQDN repeat-containing protein [Legionella birminghamensis]|uniref:KQDN repeat-containing protein n=1 Tax=Legionella birminghamensis TaxID=28083 RepID=A0A378I578_9GAMM|nr:BatD family protein [Legionella birminghamensis]KTC70244.1 KQDN repeat-containing protein [Legionella birminghamensis]STX30348.1 KQDN repeat-containing protein [Legionella birminghamensis]
MKKIISLLILVYSGVLFAQLSMQLESSKVQIGQSFRLILTLDGQSNAVPDLTPLQDNFKIVGTERSTNYSLINGQARTLNQWTVFLVPIKLGMISIPSLQVGQEHTAPTNIEVTAGNSTQTTDKPLAKQEDIQLIAEVDNKTPYVNQQVIYTVKLYNSLQLLDTDFQGPQVDNALLVPLGDGRQYQTTENGRLFSVVEQQYAIFPQKSGELTVNPPSFSALVYDQMPHKMKISAEPLNLQIKPAPASFTGKEWLPANQVMLSDHYDKEPLNLQQGDTLTRVVTLEVVGMPAQLLPQLDFKGKDDFSVYPEKADEKNSYRQPYLVGTKTVKVTYLFNKAGKITIPELRLPWFNTVTQKNEVAVLAPRVIQISASANDAGSSASPASEPQPAATESAAVTSSPDGKTASRNWLAWGLAALFALAWLLTLGAGRFNFSKGNNKKAALKRIQTACLNNQAVEAQQSLIQWAALNWPDTRILSLADICEQIHDMNLKKQINELSEVLYHPQRKAWQGRPLWEALQQNLSGGAARRKSSLNLPPINPTA